jgi:ribosome-associated protein
LATASKTARKPRSASKAAPAKSNTKKTAPAKSAAPKTAPKEPRTAKPKTVPAKSDPVEILRRQVLAALDELKAKDVHEIDVRGKTSIADILFIASGTSTRHVKSLADEVVKFVKKAGMMPLGVEGQREAEWVLVDLGDIIVHVMLPRIREFYGLERLWTVGDDMPAVAANSD